MCARRQPLPFSLSRAGPAAGPVAAPAEPTSVPPRPTTVEATVTPSAAFPVAAKDASASPPAAAITAANPAPALDPLPEEDEDELSSSSTSSHNGTGAICAQASSRALSLMSTVLALLSTTEVLAPCKVTVTWIPIEQLMLTYGDSLGNGAVRTVLSRCACCSRIVCSYLDSCRIVLFQHPRQIPNNMYSYCRLLSVHLVLIH